MEKKIKSLLMKSDLIAWLENHARNYFAIETNFSVLCNKILTDYARSCGFKNNNVKQNDEVESE